MIIKTFAAESAAAALKLVRREMGGDAVLLKTREIAEAPFEARVEITALVDRLSVGRAATILGGGKDRRERPTPESLNRTTGQIPSLTHRTRLITDSLSGDGELIQIMRDADLPDDYIRERIEGLDLSTNEPGRSRQAVYEALVADLRSIIDTAFDPQPGDRVALIGAAASGKTSVTGKLAAGLITKTKRKVRLVSLDNVKVAAAGEIQSYGELLGIDVGGPFPEYNFTDTRADEITLIDTPALPTDALRLDELRHRLEAARPTQCLVVLSAVSRSVDVADLLRRVEDFRPTCLIATMLDLTSRYGSLITAGRSGGLKLVLVSDAPGGMGELKAPDPVALASSMLHMEVTDE
jgi:flagellar biosynthesis protein FlhF